MIQPSKLKDLNTKFQGGTGNITYQPNNSGGGVVNITFPRAFSQTPTVVATPRGTGAPIITLHLSNVSTTGFSVIGRTTHTANMAGSFNWFAYL